MDLPDELHLDHEAANARYTATVTGVGGYEEPAGMLRYHLDGAVVVIPNVVVVPRFRKAGVASALTRRAFDDARAAGRTVRSECWYVDSWMDRHPQYDDLRSRTDPSGHTMER